MVGSVFLAPHTTWSQSHSAHLHFLPLAEDPLSRTTTSFYLDCDEEPGIWSVSQGPKVNFTKAYERFYREKLRDLKAIFATNNAPGGSFYPLDSSFTAKHARLQPAYAMVDSLGIDYSNKNRSSNPIENEIIENISSKSAPKIGGDPDIAAKICVKEGVAKCGGFCANPFLGRTYFYEGEGFFPHEEDALSAGGEAAAAAEAPPTATEGEQAGSAAEDVAEDSTAATSGEPTPEPDQGLIQDPSQMKQRMFFVYENTPKYKDMGFFDTLSETELQRDRYRFENRWFCYANQAPSVVTYMRNVVKDAEQNGGGPNDGKLYYPNWRRAELFPPGQHGGGEQGADTEDPDAATVDISQRVFKEDFRIKDDARTATGQNLGADSFTTDASARINFREGDDESNISAMKQICSNFTYQSGLAKDHWPVGDACDGFCYNKKSRKGRFFANLLEKNPETGVVAPKKDSELYEDAGEQSGTSDQMSEPGQWACFFANAKEHVALTEENEHAELLAKRNFLHNRECLTTSAVSSSEKSSAHRYTGTADCTDPDTKLGHQWCERCTKTKQNLLLQPSMFKAAMHALGVNLQGPKPRSPYGALSASQTIESELNLAQTFGSAFYSSTIPTARVTGSSASSAVSSSESPAKQVCRNVVNKFVGRTTLPTLGDIYNADAVERGESVCGRSTVKDDHYLVQVKKTKDWFYCCENGDQAGGETTSADSSQASGAQTAKPHFFCEPITVMRNSATDCVEQIAAQQFKSSTLPNTTTLEQKESKCAQVCFSRLRDFGSFFKSRKYHVDCVDTGVPGQLVVPGVNRKEEQSRRANGKKVLTGSLKVLFL
ncbi:unnamed protein product [Amoebophrya sp. A120]|nr:unnamed protein product [Amoebophrya sp. A120]|eukprot:GSA120T00014381001.1